MIKVGKENASWTVSEYGVFIINIIIIIAGWQNIRLKYHNEEHTLKYSKY